MKGETQALLFRLAMHVQASIFAKILSSVSDFSVNEQIKHLVAYYLKVRYLKVRHAL